MLIILIFLASIALNSNGFMLVPKIFPKPARLCNNPMKTEISDDLRNLKKTLIREYATFFEKLDRNYYANDVEFIDPLNSFTGIDKYQENVDMLAGRTLFGKFMFTDSSILLHKLEQLNENQIQTRWTLQTTIKSLPWSPTAKFSGISIYTLNSAKKVQKQVDYWDSINLINGVYRDVGKTEGIQDFLSQLQPTSGAQLSAPEFPYTLLRRAKFYEVRRYPAQICIDTEYDQRPEGYDRLASYAGGSNVNNQRLTFYAPTIMTITEDIQNDNLKNTQKKRQKTMSWPMIFLTENIANSSAAAISSYLPASTVPSVQIAYKPETVVACLRFEAAATEVIARKCIQDLIVCLQRDGFRVSDEYLSGVNKCIVGQFDALFSLQKRRNEVWIELTEHLW
jgi:hypothetical protein